MKLKRKVDLQQDPPRSEVVRWNLSHKLLGARRVHVRIEDEGKAKLVNSIELRYREHQLPEEPFDDIRTAVERIMHAYWLDQQSDDPIQFVVEIVGVAPKRGQRAPSTIFRVDWDGDDGSPDAEEYDIQTLEGRMMRAQMDELLQVISMDRAHIGELHQTVLELSRLMAEPTRVAAALTEQSSGMQLQGMQSLIQALHMNYSHEAAKELEEQKTKRAEMMWDKVGDYIGPVVNQGLGFLFGKRLPRGGGRDSSASADEPSAQETDTAVDHDNPLAAMAEIFGESITPRQRRQMTDALEPEHVQLFDDLFCSETDAQAMHCYQELLTKVPPPAFAALSAVLTDEQKEDFANFNKLAADAGAPEPRPTP